MKKKCKKGYSCGKSCISVKKACKVSFSEGVSVNLETRAVELQGEPVYKQFVLEGKAFLENIPGWNDPAPDEWIGNWIRDKHLGVIDALLKVNKKSVDPKELVNEETLIPSWSPEARVLTDSELNIAIGSVNSFAELLGGGGFLNKPLNLLYENPRAWASKSDNAINIGDNTPQSLYHELGHHWEYNDPVVSQAALEFRKSRATSLTPKPLGGGYDDSEIGYPGDYIHPYMGKVYQSNSTEVISMGIQHFSSYRDMHSLFTKDPEMYQMMVGLILHQRSKK